MTKMKVKVKPLETEVVKEQEKICRLQLSMQAEASDSQALKRVQWWQFNIHLHCFVP